MIEEYEFETYLSLTPKSFSIYVLDKKNLKNIYEDKIIIKDTLNSLDNISLTKFLDNNIFKIEKIIGKFIKNIIVIIENNQIFKINIGIKKKNYQDTNNDKYLESVLTEAKDLIKETYKDKKIMHMIVDRFIINNEDHLQFIQSLKGDHLCVEINFIIISNNLVLELDKLLEKYQIEISRYLDQKYVLNLFKESDIKFSSMVYKVTNGYNLNEVNLVPKNIKKYGFFEKFFQLFS